MQKNEAQDLAIKRSNLIMEYLTQILSDSLTVHGKMEFLNTKIDSQDICTLDIYVPARDFERHLNLGITEEHELALFKQVLNDLLKFLPHESIGVSRYYSIKSMLGGTFSGVRATNSIGSEIKINFNTTGPEFGELARNYQKKYDEFVDSLNNERPKRR